MSRLIHISSHRLLPSGVKLYLVENESLAEILAGEDGEIFAVNVPHPKPHTLYYVPEKREESDAHNA